MRDASGIDKMSTPLTPEDAQRLAREREVEERAAKHREHKRLEQEAANRAMGTPAAKSFEEICIKAAEAAVEAYTSGQSSFELEHDLTRTEVQRRVLGIKVSTKKVEDIEKQWMYFRVRVLLNGKLDNSIGWTGETLQHPYHDGYVIVMEIYAPWIKEALVCLFDNAGYQRTTYVSFIGGKHQVMSYKLAYALPTFRPEDRQSNLTTIL